jgi:4-aminobutyrate aminotransferase-like enzyme/Ser/Thr protein kinase RdoA (MazF antagonist)
MSITLTQALQLAAQHYHLSGQIKSLQGEVDYNFYLQTEEGEEYTIKVSRPDADLQSIQFQTAIMNHLAACAIELQLPEVVSAKNGSAYLLLENQRYLRVQKWVPGRMLADVNPRSANLLHSWGTTVGLLSRHLQGFDHPGGHRFYHWNPSETLNSKKHRAYIQGEEEGEIADYFWNLFETTALPQLAALRKSINYNDAHEHNLLVNEDLQNPRVRGVIDFGDALFTETVNELAIACAYAGMYLPDPLEAVAQVVRGYHEVFPLTQKELAVLFPLMCARLTITVATSAWNKHIEPENEYLLISEKPAWAVLKKWRKIAPALAGYTFREVCGFEPCPAKTTFEKWLSGHKNQCAALVDFSNKKIVPLDLNVGSMELGNNARFENNAAFTKTINRLLEDKNAAIGIGGYGEVRPFYSTDAYVVQGNSGVQWRTTHLGVDVWMQAGTPVYAPWKGTVHSYKNNAQDRDYGPTIILEHKVSDDFTFYTLYGHLSADSLEVLQQGMHVAKGQAIASIGSAPENGNWPPHLHFQILLDTLGNQGDFPGVAFPEAWPVWSSICPDPAALFPAVSFSNKRFTIDEILKDRKQYLGKSLSVSYSQPLHMVRGYKQYLYDHSGRRYLDTVNNVPHVGHQHPRVVKVAQQQMALLNTNTRYLHEHIVEYAKELLATFPPEFSVVHFVNSGSEANELAMRMVQAATGKKDMVALEVGYHGNTGGCIAVSSYKFDGKGGQGAPPYTHIVPLPDTYRGLYRNKETAGLQYASHVAEAVKKVQAAGRNIGGFIGESIVSCGGQIVLPAGYLKAAYAFIRSAGGLCIADEVQVGFGRVGEHFWGFELQGVVPDIVTMGKPMGNGHPLAAVVTTPAVAAAFANGMEYFNTFGGNPVSCAIGREVLRVIKEEELQAHAKAVGDYLTKGLQQIQQEFSVIGDVRGHGLFLGFELVKDRETLAPAAEEATYLVNRMRERGVLMSTDGPLHNVVKIKPPMCFGPAPCTAGGFGDVDFLVEELGVVLGEDFFGR